MKLDIRKGSKQLGSALEKAAELGKKAADNTVVGAQALAVKA